MQCTERGQQNKRIGGIKSMNNKLVEVNKSTILFSKVKPQATIPSKRDEDGAFGCVLEEMKGGCGERKNDRVDFPAMCREDGGK